MKDGKITNKFLLILMTLIMILPMNLVHATTNGLEEPQEKASVIQGTDEIDDKLEDTQGKLKDNQDESYIFDKEKSEEQENSTEKEKNEADDKNTNTSLKDSEIEENLEVINESKDLESINNGKEADLYTDELELVEEILNDSSNIKVENDINYYTNRYLKQNAEGKYIDKDGYLTVVSEAWVSSPAEYEIDSHDIILLFDQSAAAKEYRDVIFKATQGFVSSLDTGGEYEATDSSGGHKISVLGYGRIDNNGEYNVDGKGANIKSNNYNTGYYNKNSQFISESGFLKWTEGTPPSVNPAKNITEYNNTFLSPEIANKFFSTTKDEIISRWNAKASRLDVGLVLTEKIIQDSKSDNKKIVLVFSNAVAIQNRGWPLGYSQKFDDAISVANRLKDSTAILTIGKYNEVFGQPTIESIGNFKRQMTGVASKPENALIVDNDNTYETQVRKAFDIMAEEITQGKNINIKEKFNPVFEIIESDVYKYDYLKYEEDIPEFNNENTLVASVNINKNENEVNYESSIEPIPEQSEGSPRGEKIVVETKLKIKDGFLGGNNVKTNIDEDAGLYNKSGNNKLADFSTNPEINIPVKEISIDAKDRYTYLLNDLKRQELATVKVGDTSLNLTKDNYGLEEWQTSGIEPITVKFTEKDNKNISLTSLKENKEYKVKVEVKPKVEADKSLPGEIAIEKVAETTSNIYVFEPEFTFKDSIAYYGDEAPDYKSENVVNENNKPRWINKKIIYDIEKMIGPAPEITLDYNIEDNKVENNIIKTKENILVDVTSHIEGTDVTKYTKFINTPLVEEDYNWPVNEPKFIILIKTVSLNIKKQGGSTSEPYVFTIYKDRVPYTEASVLGNNEIDIYELPVGTYTVDEDQKWSWRYKGDNGNKVTLSATNDSDVIIVKNTKDKNNWLNSFSKVIENVYGKAIEIQKGE